MPLPPAGGPKGDDAVPPPKIPLPLDEEFPDANGDAVDAVLLPKMPLPLDGGPKGDEEVVPPKGLLLLPIAVLPKRLLLLPPAVPPKGLPPVILLPPKGLLLIPAAKGEGPPAEAAEAKGEGAMDAPAFASWAEAVGFLGCCGRSRKWSQKCRLREPSDAARMMRGGALSLGAFASFLLVEISPWNDVTREKPHSEVCASCDAAIGASSFFPSGRIRAAQPDCTSCPSKCAGCLLRSATSPLPEQPIINVCHSGTQMACMRVRSKGFPNVLVLLMHTSLKEIASTMAVFEAASILNMA
jgi:hypothetical protein